MTDIACTEEKKTRPKNGQIRSASTGARSQIVNDKSCQNECISESNCETRDYITCRNQSNSEVNVSLEESKTPELGETQTIPNGNRRVRKGERWCKFCSGGDCGIQTKGLCKKNQNQRISLPNPSINKTNKARSVDRNESVVTQERSTRVRKRTHSDPQEDPKENVESDTKPILPEKSTSTVQSNNSKRLRRDDSNANKVELLPTTNDLYTRAGRRIRCSRLSEKYSSTDKKDPPGKHKSEHQTSPVTKLDLNALLTPDTVEIKPTISSKESEISQTTNDINKEDSVLPNRKRSLRKKKGSSKSITSYPDASASCSSASDMSTKDKVAHETLSNDSHATSSLKQSEHSETDQFVEIPAGSVSPSCFDSPSRILEQFGIILKKEEEVDEESLICVSPACANRIESPCETLQDFLRLEEMKKKEFILDCQRISYRLAKIQDCIGSLSSTII